VPLMRTSSKAAGIAVLCAATAACPGLLAPVDGGADGSGAGGMNDGASADADASVMEAGEDGDGFVPCDYDATDENLCTPPANDLLIADPPSVQVAAGSYGVATFEATGPWASDPTFYIWYETTTLPVEAVQQVTTYGTPQSIPFLVPPSAAGTQGTVTVAGHAGNIERHASVSVNVTTCQPWAPSTVCPGQECGFQGDGCGGLLSCGTCPASAPYCWVGQCVTSMPVPCPSAGEGFDPDAGKCIPCDQSPACNPCPNPLTMPHQTGYCISSDSMCICDTLPSGQVILRVSSDGSSQEQ
jgi:hypothetical protein